MEDYAQKIIEGMDIIHKDNLASESRAVATDAVMAKENCPIIGEPGTSAATV